MPATTATVFFVTYSPRGFANELRVRAVPSIKGANEFRDEIDGDVNAYTLPTDSASHRRMVRLMKIEADRLTGGDVLAYQAEVGEYALITEDK